MHLSFNPVRGNPSCRKSDQKYDSNNNNDDIEEEEEQGNDDDDGDFN